ncbi:uncharacterized protein JN550_003501 [Neoarthrinium moseri]|uniref:uncharacterized protein n=1 Tax=Neoarthrinium moseri TaxID=1658444 RepID=UPI001FDCA758|nr:uncharacterized protein JN550_003501 [Neoarthrinium moseri]KAI1873248.1 hypothetical protein JN550_003501 [Neoarthrinium moseri]
MDRSAGRNNDSNRRQRPYLSNVDEEDEGESFREPRIHSSPSGSGSDDPRPRTSGGYRTKRSTQPRYRVDFDGPSRTGTNERLNPPGKGPSRRSSWKARHTARPRERGSYSEASDSDRDIRVRYGKHSISGLPHRSSFPVRHERRDSMLGYPDSDMDPYIPRSGSGYYGAVAGNMLPYGHNPFSPPAVGGSYVGHPYAGGYAGGYPTPLGMQQYQWSPPPPPPTEVPARTPAPAPVGQMEATKAESEASAEVQALKRELEMRRAIQLREEELKKRQELEEKVKRETEEAVKKAAEEKRLAFEEAKRDAERAAEDARRAEKLALEERQKVEKAAEERGKREALAQIEADRAVEEARLKRQVEEAVHALQETEKKLTAEREAKQGSEGQERQLRQMLQQLKDEIKAEILGQDQGHGDHSRSRRFTDQPNLSRTPGLPRDASRTSAGFYEAMSNASRQNSFPSVGYYEPDPRLQQFGPLHPSYGPAGTAYHVQDTMDARQTPAFRNLQQGGRRPPGTSTATTKATQTGVPSGPGIGESQVSDESDTATVIPPTPFRPNKEPEKAHDEQGRLFPAGNQSGSATTTESAREGEGAALKASAEQPGTDAYSDIPLGNQGISVLIDQFEEHSIGRNSAISQSEALNPGATEFRPRSRGTSGKKHASPNLEDTGLGAQPGKLAPGSVQRGYSPQHTEYSQSADGRTSQLGPEFGPATEWIEGQEDHIGRQRRLPFWPEPAGGRNQYVSPLSWQEVPGGHMIPVEYEARLPPQRFALPAPVPYIVLPLHFLQPATHMVHSYEGRFQSTPYPRQPGNFLQ